MNAQPHTVSHSVFLHPAKYRPERFVTNPSVAARVEEWPPLRGYLRRFILRHRPRVQTDFRLPHRQHALQRHLRVPRRLVVQ